MPSGYDKGSVHTIEVRTASAQYPVYVGSALLSGLAERVAPLVRGRVFVLTSPPVWALWGWAFLQSFSGSASDSLHAPTVLFLPPGEPFKRLAEVERLADELAAAGADRASLLVAFGGGIVGDIGGFLAAIYMRGIPYIQVPTTLLAQVDSSVGGKTGANLAAGKNLVGAFHQPAAVIADVDVLRTLSARELRAGMAEVVKAAILRDAELFAVLEARMPELLAPDCEAALLAEVIARAVAIKAAVVGEDERESGVRMILNLGHTIGHAIEAVTRYAVLLHGEAIAWGMLPALSLARGRGLITEREDVRMRTLLAALGPAPGFECTAADLLQAAAGDKKNRVGQRRFVLPRGIGAALVAEDVTDNELLAATEAMLAEARRG